MNVNAVPVLLDHIAKKSMLAHRVRAPTMAFVLIYHKDMMAIRTSAYARTVSIYLRAFYFFFLSLIRLLLLFFSVCSIYFYISLRWGVVEIGCDVGGTIRRIRFVSTSFILLLILFAPILMDTNKLKCTHIKWMNYYY